MNISCVDGSTHMQTHLCNVKISANLKSVDSHVHIKSP